MNLSDTAITILNKRYLFRDKAGNITETPKEMCQRVAQTVAAAEWQKDDSDADSRFFRRTEEYYRATTDLAFLPNSPCLAGAGRKLQQLSACYVCPIEDSLKSIFKTLSDAALISQGGGGVGFSFGKIRPRDDIVRSSSGIASGPVSFMKVYDAATDCIKQGSFRRGACMGVLPVSHPDIEEFITVKRTPGVLTNFNLSVGITDDFMNAVDDDADWDLVNPRTNQICRTVKARDLWNLIVESAWASGEPGVLFLDTVNAANPLPGLGKIDASNPCGEQVLLPYQSCVLGSINLAKIVSPNTFTLRFDYLDKLVRTGVRFLNGVIDVSDYPIPEIAEMTKATRPIGLGVMGWADLLVLAGVPYDSEEALDLANLVMRRITETAWDESRKLAKEYGAFPALDKSIFADDPNPPRNSTITTVAPTGTVSMIANCSSGIEPIFAVAYTKTVMDGTPFTYINPYFKQAIEERGLWSEDLADEVARTGSVQHLDAVPDDIKRLFKTAHEIAPEWHVKMQAAFQQHVTSSISKTINLSHNATVDDVRDVYKLGWTSGCKGLTCFRDGSRDEQVLTVGTQTDDSLTIAEGCATACQICAEISPAQQTCDTLNADYCCSYVAIPRDRPELTFGYTQKIQTGCGQMYLTLNNDDDGYPCETFAYCSNGGCQGLTEGVSRLISLALRCGVPVEYIVDQLTDVRCPVATKRQAEIHNKSCPDAMGKALALFAEYCDMQQELGSSKLDAKATQMIVNSSALETELVSSRFTGGICPECGDVMTEESGCRTCYNCGYSKCS